jgi:hypothetical protein
MAGDSGYEPTDADMAYMNNYYAARDAGLDQGQAQQAAMQQLMESTYSATPSVISDTSGLTGSSPNWAGDNTIYSNDQGVQGVLTQHGVVTPQSFNVLAKPGERITADTPVQEIGEGGLKVYLRDPNDPESKTYENTGIPAVAGTLVSQAYAPARNNGIFGTIGGDLLEAAKDPAFHKFLAAAAAITGGGMALNNIYGVGGLGSGAIATPIELGGAITGTELGAAPGSFVGPSGAGEFIAADAAASAAGQGAFDLASSLGMPLDKAVSAGLIGGNGALTEAGAAALLGSAGPAAGSGLGGLSTSQLARMGLPAVGSVLRSVAGGSGAGGQGSPTSGMNYVPPSAPGGGALPGNLQSTVLQGVAVPQYDPFASYDELPQLQPIAAAEGGGATQLAQMQQQINQIDPRLYRVLQNRVAPTFYTYGKDTGGTPTQLMADKLGSKPSPGYPTQASSSTRSPLYDTYGLRPATTDESEATPKSVTFKDGGDVHIPEFITGATGHYVKGRGDGQSDDIPAMLADGEYVFDAETVAQLGNGSSDAGAAVLDKMREAIRAHKRSAAIDEIPPKSKSPLEYLAEGMKGKKE